MSEMKWFIFLCGVCVSIKKSINGMDRNFKSVSKNRCDIITSRQSKKPRFLYSLGVFVTPFCVCFISRDYSELTTDHKTCFVTSYNK